MMLRGFTGKSVSMALALAVGVYPMVSAASDDPVAEAIIDYMDFATYESGIILPAQVDESVFAAATIVDTRDAAQFDAEHIPGAINIEWRQLPGQLDALPDGMVILYCNKGSLSAQATFAARVMGYENVVVLQGGLDEWRNSAAYRP
ncbi:rhodanese-like domain-containing protein [Pseudoprimorskyibacter insulae]|uniref:Thiosulfate sulfurtransferase PspE n=1 Tax=Pseudoprimorskyibacter insulae TaxID=1695997 RepID=A0A2R8AX66_9RHOB|nr:rhodanese-like domain-containing protein [Pseudoprimorskyibacter insulae]SPF80588.1 Thiosulfate sulfurtransferase PspE [Pseudoprimorskyibacter insulae]